MRIRTAGRACDAPWPRQSATGGRPSPRECRGWRRRRAQRWESTRRRRGGRRGSCGRGQRWGMRRSPHRPSSYSEEGIRGGGEKADEASGCHCLFSPSICPACCLFVCAWLCVSVWTVGVRQQASWPRVMEFTRAFNGFDVGNGSQNGAEGLSVVLLLLAAHIVYCMPRVTMPRGHYAKAKRRYTKMGTSCWRKGASTKA